ncbi:hypothetical protein PAP_03495 [Palaeococcus pacificus DY20341]|uniref:S-layer protein n=1 Tax=Palaeococcus pacificus DY20341 TaxID=1343739 RepID=A0A075LS65_9EURY|nr:S-layer protein [Palaeococcus pacificus]AIF69119.1 hypothetical protein PAP_03495 [Palaeococcus pacificus DY20341]
MKVRKIAAIAVGAAMIGATMGYASAQLNVPKDFFVKDGAPNVKIVVGSNAAAMDVASAADIAVALGSMLYTAEEVQADGVSVIVKKDVTTDPDDLLVYSNWYIDRNNTIPSATDYDSLPDNAWYNGSSYYNGAYTDWEAYYAANPWITEIEDMDSIKGDKQIDWDITVEDLKITDADTEDVPTKAPKSATLTANVTVEFNYVIKKWEVTTSDTDDQWGLTTTTTTTTIDDDQPSGGNFVEDVYSGITKEMTFTLLGNEYYVLDVTNTTLTYGNDHGENWFHVGDEMEFDGYKVQVLDISINENRALVKVTAPDGQSDLVILESTAGATDVFSDGGILLTLENTFVGIDGNLIAQVTIQTNVKTIESGGELVSGWTTTFVTNAAGDTIEKIILKKELSGSTLDILGKYKIYYKFEGDTKTADFDNDGQEDDTRYTARAWIVIEPTEKVYDTQELKVGDELEGWTIDQIKGDTYTKITVKPPAEPITVLDSEVDLNNVDSNLILVGGPVANSVTAYLVDQGVSTIDWYNSDGDIEYLEDAFGDYDVLIVAGKNREATKAAAEELMAYLKDLA